MTTLDDDRLQRYADVAVRVGVNVQSNQRLIILADLDTAPLVRAMVRSAYSAGARFVDVVWSDSQVNLARIQYASRDSLDEHDGWRDRALVELVDGGAGLLSVTSRDPDLFKDQPAELVSHVQQVYAAQRRPLSERIGRGVPNWAVIAAPSPGWAKRVFPDLEADAAMAKLWEAILAMCRIDAADPVVAWQTHLADLAARRDFLNRHRFASLHYRGPGTDLLVGLADGHTWESGSSFNAAGTEFVANMPTEEVFTAPHRARVQGTVRSSRPLNYAGVLIDDFQLVFEEGRVVKAEAAQGETVLRSLLDTDEGAARLGEVALVPHSSPVGQTGILFYNTLFDENAACHLALGAAYHFNITGGTTMDEATLMAAGGNVSNVHVDFMIGSAALDIDGIAADGSATPIMRAGEWAFTR
jgi:aminopeptidase